MNIFVQYTNTCLTTINEKKVINLKKRKGRFMEEREVEDDVIIL